MVLRSCLKFLAWVMFSLIPKQPRFKLVGLNCTGHVETIRFQYNINPWMGGDVDKEEAYQQWKSLRDAITAQGVEVSFDRKTFKFPKWYENEKVSQYHLEAE